MKLGIIDNIMTFASVESYVPGPSVGTSHATVNTKLMRTVINTPGQ